MKIYDYKNAPQALLTPDIVAMLTSIHEHKGKQELYIEAHTDALAMLMEIAKIQSTGASNRIEGIHTTDKRLEELVKDIGLWALARLRTISSAYRCMHCSA